MRKPVFTFASLTAKYLFVSAIFLLLLATFIFSGFFFTQYMKGDARRFNFAGRERMLTYKISSHMHFITASLPSPDNAPHMKEIKKAMSEYEQALYGLRDGDKDLTLKPIHKNDRELASQLNTLIGLWENSQKPVLLDIIINPAVNGKGSCQRCHSAFRDNLPRIEAFIKSLELHYEMELREFDFYRLVFLGFFVVILISMVVFVKKFLITPVKQLENAASQIEKGDFGVSVDIKSSDEIGRLGNTFNHMARTLKQLFEGLHQSNALLNTVSMAQSKFILDMSPAVVFEELLNSLLLLTRSEYGFIGEVFYNPDNEPYLKTHAITNIAWDDATREFYDKHAPKGMEFRNLKSLLGAALTTGRAVISNSPATDPRSGGLPEGHPPLNAFLGIPIYRGEKMVGMAGMANRPGGYDEKLVDYLRPFITTSANIIEAYRNDQRRKTAEEALREYSGKLKEKVKERTAELETANAELRKLFNAIEQAAESIVITDKRGLIQYVNPAFSMVSGYSREEAIGKTPGVLNSGKNPPGLFKGMWEVILSGNIWHGTVINRKKTGGLYYEEMTVAPVLNEQGDITNFIAIKNDVSDRIKSEEEIKQKNLELEEARLTAESANRAKSEFLANMSHELRTPLNAIMGFSEVLLNNMAGPVTDNQKEYISDILESGKHLLSLINDILDLSKIEAGKMELDLDEISIKELIEGSLYMIREKAMKHRIHLQTDIQEDMGLITADERKIKQVLFNLLGNAIKFTPDSGTITVAVRRVQSSALGVKSKDQLTPELRTQHSGPNTDFDIIEISVADTGIGISAEDQKKLFQPFQQLETTLLKKYAGTGLGLNLCKKFVELHGGGIRVGSEEGKGSRFIFTIPERPQETLKDEQNTCC